ncbi:undecaprenyl-phosphate glucose phosphotransferase [Tardiphaga robiniae]|uniref:Undecaprenyl-phosphate glucose phosphotransferase n=2 Tax=Tardiphaga robiniae TaxID=943830 RepID=A0A7G6U8E9_9BRAD|nr:undecaprenyl-phosphate glucose phosphotransferase [Tardiphaga robiniae]
MPYCAVGLFSSFIYLIRMSGAGHYELPESAKPGVELTKILVCWFTTALLLAFFAFFIKVGVDYSRGVFVIFNVLVPVGLLAVRKVTKVSLASALIRGTWSRNDLVLVGDEAEIASLDFHDMINLFGATDVKRFVLMADAEEATWSSSDERSMKALVGHVRDHNCREIMLAMPWLQTERIELIRERIKALPIAARLLPDRRVRALSNYSSAMRQRVLVIEIQRAPLGAAEQLVKRAMDLAISAVALATLLPVFVLTALAIKLDGTGPVIFRQRRKGFNGQEFVMYKFRTMKVHQDGAVVQAMRDDPRVTAIGKLLRAASIDELPQIINVIKGDMSLVGPRPHALAHDDQFQNLVGDYAYRHHVKPGLTGWAQCNGSRGATPSVEHVADRVKFDLWYINNWSLWLDVHIIIRTFFEVLRKRNAY